jgi:glycosyltransferase involved in cell wall biosynthesis
MQNKDNYPLVSIITVVYNGEYTIERTIKSVINQTYKNIEYIIIDGKSSDNTMKIIDQYSFFITKIISEKDGGIADAMNKGIENATGSLIGIINADDWFENNAIDLIVNASLNNKNCILHGSLRVYDSENSFYISKAPERPNLKKGMEINHPTVFVPSFIYKKFGNFDTRYKIVFDWELILRFYLKGIVFIPISNVIANFSIGGVSTTNSKKIIHEVHEIRRKNVLYKYVDYHFLRNKIRLFFFGSNIIKISQYKRLLKYKISNINFRWLLKN